MPDYFERSSYNEATGALDFDFDFDGDGDGTGAAAAIRFATLDNAPTAISGGDFLVI